MKHGISAATLVVNRFVSNSKGSITEQSYDQIFP